MYLNDNGQVLYNSPEDIYGFQFTIDGTTGSASGGDAAEAGFSVSGSSTILGFSFSGASIPAGCGVLVELDLDGQATGLSGLIFSGPGGSSIDFSYYGDQSDPDAGCTDESACNFDEEALTDDGSCVYAEENFDCDGNCLVDEDCSGQCGGDAVIGCDGICDSGLTNDDCGICDGPGAIYECGCEQLPGSISSGCDLSDNTLYILDDGSVLYN